MSVKSIAKKAFKANAITEEEYKQLLCVIKSSYESLRQKGVWINAPTVEPPEADRKVMYLCDQKKPCKEHCEKDHLCKRTSDISHAKNFRLVPNGIDPIIFEEVDEHCIANVMFDREELEKIVNERVIEPIKNGELVVKKVDGKWGKWVISEIRCPNCLEYFQTDCYSMEELKKCPVCGEDMIGGKE